MNTKLYSALDELNSTAEKIIKQKLLTGTKWNVIDGMWTKDGNVSVTLQEVSHIEERYGEQYPVLKNNKTVCCLIAIDDKSIEKEENIEAANAVVFDFLKNNGVEIFECRFRID